MNPTRRLGPGRGNFSLRSRLLAGLITVTALFLIIMGVVTTVVLGNSEQDQFNSDLTLTVRFKLSELPSLQGGYAVAYYSLRLRQVGVLSPTPSPAVREVTEFIDTLVATGNEAELKAQHPASHLFPITEPGGPALTAIWRVITPAEAEHSGGTLPLGYSYLVVARPDSAVGSEVRGLVAAELITAAILLAMLAVGGRWLISRGLAPIDRMASTADMITSQGDLTARMPDPG